MGPLWFVLTIALLSVEADDVGLVTSIAYSPADAGESGTEPDNYGYKERFSECEFMKKWFGVSYSQILSKPPKLDTLSLVYRTKNGTKTFMIDSAAEALRKAREFDEDKRLIIFVHGYTDSPTKESFTNMTRVFLDSGHVNLIALDASSVLSWNYLLSTSYVHFIGQKLGQVLADIVKQGQEPSDIHIIGHSLGAHIAGFAGKAFLELTGKLLGRISGLDPAGPCFNAVRPDTRLSPTDAAFVSVIHTNSQRFGIKEPVGHKNFYPNGGSTQPNCNFIPGCSHIRSWVLFAESVLNPLAYPAVRCADWDAFQRGNCSSQISYMGYPSSPAGNGGHYFLQTGSKYPYGLGLEGTKYKKI